MFVFFFFNDTATTEIYTLSLHDALPIFFSGRHLLSEKLVSRKRAGTHGGTLHDRRATFGSLGDRKSTRLNSSHSQISYAVFCLKKKKRLASGSLFGHTRTLQLSRARLAL